MKGAIAKCGSLFNSHRMMRRYRVEAYLEQVHAVRNALYLERGHFLLRGTRPCEQMQMPS